MSQNIVIKVENISKEYQLGVVNHRTFYREMRGRLAKALGQEDPNSRLGIPQNTDESFMALDQVSFDVHEGEAVALVGRNGAGKSTLARIISEIIYPTSGTVKVKGKISTLGTGVGFSGELTARDNVFLNGAILGMPRQEVAKRFDEIIEFAEIGRFVDTPIKRYSTGMKARLSFSAAAHFIADIIIIDEGLGGGDMFFNAKALAKMERIIRDEGRTILLVSHSLTQLRSTCTRGLLLEQGRLVQDGPLLEVLDTFAENKVRKTA